MSILSSPKTPCPNTLRWLEELQTRICGDYLQSKTLLDSGGDVGWMPAGASHAGICGNALTHRPSARPRAPWAQERGSCYGCECAGYLPRCSGPGAARSSGSGSRSDTFHLGLLRPCFCMLCIYVEKFSSAPP